MNCSTGAVHGPWVYEQVIPVDFAVEVWSRDDVRDAAWAISTMAEHAVHVILMTMLHCVAPALCGERCGGCPPAMRGDAEAEDLLRSVEAALGTAPGSSLSREPLECLEDAACLEEVAQDVARSYGASGAAPAELGQLERLAAANGALQRAFEGSHEGDDSMFNETLLRRHAAARAHAEAMAQCCRAPAGEWTQLARARRLEEAAPGPSLLPPRVQKAVEEMLVLTRALCEQIDARDVPGAAKAHMEASRMWIVLNGGFNSQCAASL